MTSGNPASNFGLGPKSCRTCSPMSIALRPQRPHFKIEMAGQLVHPDKIQTAAHKIWLIDSKYAVNCRWFWREINQPINQSSQMPPAPTPIQATVRSPHRRAIQKAVRCHAAEQVNLIRATDLIFNCNNKFMTMWKFQLWIADKETRLQQTVHWWSPWSSRWNAGASPTQAKKEQPRPFPHICHYIYQFLFNLTEPCKTRSQSHKLNELIELIFSQVQLGCSLLDVGTKATPSAHLAMRSLPFGLPQMIKLVGIALAKLNSNQKWIKTYVQFRVQFTDKTKDGKNQGTALGVACWGYGEHSLSQAWWIAGCWTSA